MTGQAEKVYDDITPQKWVLIKRAAAGYGLWINTPSGEAESFGVRLIWEYRYPVGRTEHTLKIAIIQCGLLQPAEALNFVDRIIQQAIQ